MNVNDYLFRRVPDYDAMILKDIRERDCWVESVVCGRLPDWWDVREAVRRISEGLAYRATEREEWMERTFPRVEWPGHRNEATWITAHDKARGRPCDAS